MGWFTGCGNLFRRGSRDVLRVKEPVGPFKVLDGRFKRVYGLHWKSEVQSRVFRKFIATRHLGDNGRFMIWDGMALPVNPPVIIEDCIFEDARSIPPRSSGGTSEANLWIGCSAKVRRVEMRRGTWTGLWTGGSCPLVSQGGCWYSIFEDMLIEDQDIGIYIEHVTRHSIFRRFRIEANKTGIYCEWWYEGRGSHSCLLEDFDITVNNEHGYGISLDAGTYGFVIRNGIIRGGKGIELPINLAGSPDNVVENVTGPDGEPVPIIYHDREIDHP